MATKQETQNYTLGRGMVFFSRFKPGTQVPAAWRYIGNTPEFSLTIESENLDHFSSDRGIREKDDSVPLEVTRTGSMITDNVKPENVALFFFGTKATVVTPSQPATTEDFEAVIPGHSYKLGVTAQQPAGVFGVNPAGFGVSVDGANLVASAQTITLTGVPTAGDTVEVGDVTYSFVAVPAMPYDVDIGASLGDSASNLAAAINGGAGSASTFYNSPAHPDVSATVNAGVVTVTALSSGTAGNGIPVAKSGAAITVGGAATTGGSGESFENGVDFDINYDAGLLTIGMDAGIAEGTNITVTYAVRGNTRERVISGSTPVEGALMYIANNPKGDNFNYLMPWVKITPNGDYALKGDEWQQIPFTIEALKPTNGEAILMDGAPKYI